MSACVSYLSIYIYILSGDDISTALCWIESSRFTQHQYIYNRERERASVHIYFFLKLVCTLYQHVWKSKSFRPNLLYLHFFLLHKASSSDVYLDYDWWRRAYTSIRLFKIGIDRHACQLTSLIRLCSYCCDYHWLTSCHTVMYHSCIISVTKTISRLISIE